MFSKKRTKAGTNSKRRTTGVRLERGSSNLSGDIPPRQRTDYSTSSIRVPPTSSQLSFRQLAPLVRITASSTGAVTQDLAFSLSGVYGGIALSTLFDFYRIDAVRITVRPENTAVQLVDPTVDKLLPLYWVIDYNDLTPLLSEAVATEYDNCMVLGPGESAARTFQPRYSMVVKSVSGTDYVNRVGDWLNTSSDDILHYGCKFFVPQGASGQTRLQTWLVEVEYYFTFRQVI